MLSIERASETCLVLRALDKEHCGNFIAALAKDLSDELNSSFIDIIPAYTSLTLVVDFPRHRCSALIEPIKSIMQSVDVKSAASVQTHQLPIYYHPEVGPDLENLARSAGLSTAEVIELHHQALYRVKAIGFAPGFAYLSGLPDVLRQPRLSQPRAHVAAGSLGIADDMTAVYPLASPGGWNIIGRCPLRIFDPAQQERSKICPFKVGDELKFHPISRDEFIELGGELE